MCLEKGSERLNSADERGTEESPTSEVRFSYTPLDADAQEIRLIHLCRTSENYGLSIDLVTYPPSNVPPYKAVSYVWGSQHRSRQIICYGLSFTNGYPNIQSPSTCLPVSDTIYKLLKEIQRRKVSSLLWIDAICINQDDVRERSQQVQMMHRIYLSADQVVVWLPLAQNASPLLSEEKIVASVMEFSRLYDEAKRTVKRLKREDEKRSCRTELSLLDVMKDLELSWSHWLALEMLLNDPWFRRTWVVQEVTLAKHVIIWYGSGEMDWEDLNKASDFTHLLAYHELRDKVQSVRAITHVRGLFKEFERRIACADGYVDVFLSLMDICKRLTLHELLVMTQGREATDPRDKLYAVLGLAIGQSFFRNIYRQESIIFPEVDYTLSVRDVYVSAAAACMTVQGPMANIDFLTSADQKRSRVNDSGEYWPSWVPDWRISPTRLSVREFMQACASGGRDSNATILPNHSHTSSEDRHGPCLRVSGLIVLVVGKFLQDKSWTNDRKHADVINGLPLFYPTTSMHYLDVYHKVLGSNEPKHFLVPDTAKGMEFWEYIESAESILTPSGEPNTINMKGSDATESTGPSKDSKEESLLEPSNLYTSSDFDARATLRAMAHSKTWEHQENRSRAGRKIFISTTGFMGQVPLATEVGDQIAILFGVGAPFVVRPDGDHFTLIGDCYVLGLMEGEAMVDLDESRVQDLFFW